VYSDGKKMGKTGKIGAGGADSVTFNVAPNVSHALSFVEQGFTEGCNSGALLSIAGTLRVTYSVNKVKIRGTVFGSDGQPFKGLDVHSTPAVNASNVTDAKGQFVLSVDPGHVPIFVDATHCQPGAAVAKEVVDATHGDTTVRFTVPTQIVVTSASDTRIGFCILGLPTKVSGFDLTFHRNPPVKTGTCTDTQSDTWQNKSGLRWAESSFDNPPVGDRFCAGSYTVTLTGTDKAGVEWAKENFKVRASEN
jgi:hypothetical protein